MSWLLNTEKATEQFGARLVDGLEGTGIVSVSYTHLTLPTTPYV
mgnify:CR=1 FL=1